MESPKQQGSQFEVRTEAGRSINTGMSLVKFGGYKSKRSFIARTNSLTVCLITTSHVQYQFNATRASSLQY